MYLNDKHDRRGKKNVYYRKDGKVAVRELDKTFLMT